MITLITGLPGNGKTLYAIWWLKARAEKEGRAVYYSGINDLRLPWIETDPQKWHELPKGSIIIIDEVQRVMRPRQHGSAVPEFVAKLETHRHLGVDLVLITQHPMLLDSNVRRLVGQHFHCVRKFGTQMATVHEWNAVKESCDKNREDSIRHEFKYPKDVYTLYKSAELHTHKARIPMKVWALLALILLVPALGWLLWTRIDPSRKQAELDAQQGTTAETTAGPRQSAQRQGPKSVHEYTADFVPRVAGLAYTAPAYDEVTKPVEAPYPAACVQMAARCDCFSQQGTKLQVTPGLCEGIVKGGFFIGWKTAEARQGVYPLAQRQEALGGPLPVVAGAASLGGSPTSHFTAQTQSAAPVVSGVVEQAPAGRGHNRPLEPAPSS